MKMDSVIVFGDSLSDIGKKWVTKSGRLARATNQMYVSPTGRFSDCRNWTDFMIEEATGLSMIFDSAQKTVDFSKNFTSLSKSSRFVGPNSFYYANYAEGGACGHTPASKGPFLGTFKDQVDAFAKDCEATNERLGNMLFIIWFGANDLYTAGCTATQMATVAQEVATVQRNRLATLAQRFGTAAVFIFVNLARPLTSVRYTMRLKKVEAKLRELADPNVIEMKDLSGRFQGSMEKADSALEYDLYVNQGKKRSAAYEQLAKQVNEIKELEKGVVIYNRKLAELAAAQNDFVTEIDTCLSEEAISQLVASNSRLVWGASSSTATHVSSSSYEQATASSSTTTIDEVHPTDQVYKLIWLEIRKEITKAGCTFGGGASGAASSSSPTQPQGGASSSVPTQSPATTPADIELVALGI
ncbi:SGNH/GDSL hydrolase family protein [Pseudomonas sp. NPDC089534]|uniref:SGNH/GDSL hydrolase family protein n=1 Tax=Pseudomonas sp. NPDC089534 TaxID=3364468 RepID=UPI00380A17FA